MSESLYDACRALFEQLTIECIGTHVSSSGGGRVWAGMGEGRDLLRLYDHPKSPAANYFALLMPGKPQVNVFQGGSVQGADEQEVRTYLRQHLSA